MYVNCRSRIGIAAARSYWTFASVDVQAEAGRWLQSITYQAAVDLVMSRNGLRESGVPRFRPHKQDVVKLFPPDDERAPAHTRGGGTFNVLSHVELLFCPGDGQAKWDRATGDLTSVFAAIIAMVEPDLGEDFQPRDAIIRFSNSRAAAWFEAAIASIIQPGAIAYRLLQSSMPRIICYGKPGGRRRGRCSGFDLVD